MSLFKDIIREVEAFDYKCEDFIKIRIRFFEDIFRKLEALIRNLSLFEDFFNVIEAF
jgi:hypothetical protein